ncbi:MAG: superoxide dismutase [Candidatus Hydrogenedentota bacterium]|nr:MAG: superoxide dismutase [Candidatus Hydrogenedentota bacterium]
MVLGLLAMAVGMSNACVAEEGSDSKGAASITKAVCVLKATKGNSVSGTITFTQQKDGVLVEAHVMGLKPNSKHGFHIHEFGDISSPDGKSTGGHFNPTKMDHAGPNSAKRHWGDLGNLEADENGHATHKSLDKVIMIHGEHTILSRGITVHAGEDDLKSQPTGAAGARIAVGVIGLAKTE